MGCCGCWKGFAHSLKSDKLRNSKKYRRAKYNEREFSIEFENLIEEEDFYAPPQNIMSEVEKELLATGKYDELLKYEKDLGASQDEILRQQEENVRMEDEAFIQAKMEASRMSKQKQAFDKSKIPNMKMFNSAQFSKWLSEENIDITSPDIDFEDFDAFLEKVKAKSAVKLDASEESDSVWQQTLSRGVEATKIAGNALSALQPVDLHAVVNNDATTKDVSNNDPYTTMQSQQRHGSSNDDDDDFVSATTDGFEQLLT